MKWKYKKKAVNSIEDVPEGAIAFIYQMTNKKTKRSYIGKKYLYSERKKALTKKEIAALENKRLKKWKLERKESDWLTYNSSCEEIKKEIAEGQEFTKEILYWTFNKISTTYLEVRSQFEKRVLESDNWYNSNINSSWFKGNLGL